MKAILVILMLALSGCASVDRGCHIDGMITDFNDNDGCVSPETRYCTMPGYIFDPNSGPNDLCVSP
jgi:hypothetical protein